MKREGIRILLVILAAVLVLVAVIQCVFLLRHPYFRQCAAMNGISVWEASKTWGRPDRDAELILGMICEANQENWPAVAKLAEKYTRPSEIATYYYNLANAKLGCLPDRLLDYYQPFDRGLFLEVGPRSNPFKMACAGDVWFELGYMPLAERDAMLGMLFSPAHKGSRYLRRLAETNLVTGDFEAASKYLRILLNDRRDRQWALERFPDAWSAGYRQRIEEKRALLPRFDVVHGMDQTPIILRILLGSNSSNKMALDYLLCYDLLTKDLDAFVGDYDPSLTHSQLYEEAMLIFLAAKGGMTGDNLQHYHISPQTLERFNHFVTIYKRDNGAGHNLSGDFGKSYWFYFYFATRNAQD